MPPEHQFYSQWSPERFLRWASVFVNPKVDHFNTKKPTT